MSIPYVLKSYVLTSIYKSVRSRFVFGTEYQL